MTTRRLAALIVALGAFLLLPTSVWADFPNPEISTAYGFQNVVEHGDVLVMVNYRLDEDTWRTADYMLDHTCEDIFDYADPCYTSLRSGAAKQTLRAANGDLLSSRNLPRITYGLSSVYLCAPDSDSCAGRSAAELGTYGDSAIETCIVGPTTVDPQPSTCETAIDWKHSQTVEQTIAQITAVIIHELDVITTGLSAPNTDLVDGGTITAKGSIFAREAFPLVVFVAPEAFHSGTLEVIQSFDATAPHTAITGSMTAITNDARSSGRNAYLLFEELGDRIGVSGQVLGTLFTLTLAALVFAWVTIGMGAGIPNAPLLGLGGGLLIVFGGFFLGLVNPAPLFVAMTVVSIIGAAHWVRNQVPA